MKLDLWSKDDTLAYRVEFQRPAAETPIIVSVGGVHYARKSGTVNQYKEGANASILAYMEKVSLAPDWKEKIANAEDAHRIGDGDLLINVPPGSSQWISQKRGLELGILIARKE